MYNYTEKVLGISLNPTRDEDSFIEKCNELISEMDGEFSEDDLRNHDFESVLADPEFKEELKFIFESDYDLAYSLLEWLYKYAIVKTGYSGSSPYTPIIITLNPSCFKDTDPLNLPENLPGAELDDYVLNTIHLVQLGQRVKFLRSFCKKTMPKDLFDKLEKRIGLVFWQLTS